MQNVKVCAKHQTTKHIRSGRYVCPSCTAEAQARYRKAHPDKIRADKKLYKERHPAKVSTYQKSYHRRYRHFPSVKVKRCQSKQTAQYREYMRSYAAKWYRLNPGKVHRRRLSRAQRLSGAGSFTRQEWQTLCARYGNQCLCCGNKTKLTPDHVVPLAHGGSNTIDNIQPLCLTCNLRKSTKHWDYR